MEKKWRKLMGRKEYSAGMVKFSFWFSEFKKVIKLLNSGMSLENIKILNLEENIFSVSNKIRSISIFNTVSNRIKILNLDFHRLFEGLDISNQKLINLISIMETDSLFFDFMYELYREKLIIGLDEMTDSDFKLFFKDKQLQSQRVASWQDKTFDKLRSSYKMVLFESGILEKVEGAYKIKKPILDPSLELKLKEHRMDPILHALTGVR